MSVATRLAAALAAMLMLLAPAIWNGFPLLQYDTGGYFARWYEGTLEESRSTVYGLFLDLLARPDFWPVVVVQAALTVWILWLTLRVHGLGKMRALLATVAVLSCLTTLPWIADVLLTDIFAGLSVLALYLIVLHAGPLQRWERAALVVVIAFASAAHSGTMATLLALIAAGALVAPFNRALVPVAGLGRGIGTLALGAAMLLTANYAVAGRLAWTPGGIALSFGRMLTDGIVKRFLDEHCPDSRLRLCDHIQELPDDADVFFWGESVFDRLGRFEGMHDEMQTIVLESLRDYPWLHVKTAVTATLTQLAMVRTGGGVLTTIWHTYGMIENFAPAALPGMRAARQQKDQVHFVTINRVHVPVAWASMMFLLALIALAIKRKYYADLGLLAATAALAILANAVVFGALSGPHNRYGARLAWLATFVVLLVPMRAALRESRPVGT